MTASAWRVLKWALICYASIIGVGGAIVIGTIFYIVNSAPCDSALLDSIEAENLRGDTARAEIEICNFFDTIVNTSISLQLNGATGILPKKTLIGYEYADSASDPILRWVDDNTLSVDLGKVYWISSRITRWGPVRIIYSYSVVNRPG